MPLDTGVSRYIGGYCKGSRRREIRRTTRQTSTLEAVRLAIRIRVHHRAWLFASHADPYVTQRHVIPNALRNSKSCQWGHGRSRTRLLTVARRLRFLALVGRTCFVTSYAKVSLHRNRSWPLEATRENEKVDSPPRMPSYAVVGAVDSRLRGNDGGGGPIRDWCH